MDIVIVGSGESAQTIKSLLVKLGQGEPHAEVCLVSSGIGHRELALRLLAHLMDNHELLLEKFKANEVLLLEIQADSTVFLEATLPYVVPNEKELDEDPPPIGEAGQLVIEETVYKPEPYDDLFKNKDPPG